MRNGALLIPTYLSPGQRSYGPLNTTSTQSNATKHGLLAVRTELDDAEAYRTTLSEPIREKNPVGTMEMFLVKSAAFDTVNSRVLAS
jgi:hypothetical protein